MADENEPPPDSKLTRTKQRWAREGRFLTGKTSRPEQQRLPPGQHLTRDWPVLDLGLTPQVSRERWRQCSSIINVFRRSQCLALHVINVAERVSLPSFRAKHTTETG